MRSRPLPPRRLPLLRLALALLAPVVSATAGCGNAPSPQSAPAAPAPHAALGLTAVPLPDDHAVEAAQLVADDHFWPGADLLVADRRKGVQLLDANGAVLATLPGRHTAIDHRAHADALLLATVDAADQRATLRRLDAATHHWSAPLRLPRTAWRIEALCLYQDEGGNGFVFLVGEDGVGEQWLVAQGSRPLERAQRVRGLALPPGADQCAVDDAGAHLIVDEEDVGLWAYGAHPEAAAQRRPVDLRAPFGALAGQTGFAALPDAVVVADPAAGLLRRYRAQDGGWQADGTHAAAPAAAVEALGARARGDVVELLARDEDGALLRGRIDRTPPGAARPAPLPLVAAAVQTTPVPGLGDAADDPAIWVHPSEPARSRVLGTDKQGGLLVWDLEGRLLQDLRVGRLNNVDVRAGFALGGHTVDLAVASNRDHDSLHLFAIERGDGSIRELGEIPTGLENIYGLCLGRAADGSIHAFANGKGGHFEQYRLSAPSGRIAGERVRAFALGGQPEGCVVDDPGQRLYAGEEDVGVWMIDARADAPAAAQPVIGVGGPLRADVEGLALYHGARASYLVVSSQGNDSYLVLDAAPPWNVRGAFRIGLDAARGIDGASETDGLDVTAANLGGPWAAGMLVVQDGRKRMPEENQNFKYVPWSAIAEALKLE